ncbi:hypothetical protein [Photobacterium sp. 1_MG-2023]|uniref:hypothetical protein n=1 Tax=Photobacterium sp. 1_MG-2023 TaxID=3062646 RepID=UPI0026E17A94|nr:hypothetical protein [Photobacterium sp. 1_MG-2023]MDO6705964.1 hypothetical protein [Photobacterium sp. 1_MG-2023]
MSTNNFESLVQKGFSFLVSDYHFRCVEVTNHVVRFESDKVFVAVRYDADRSYELDVEIGELNVLYGGQERPFNMGEILRLEGVAEKERYTFFQASTPSVLANCVAKLSSLLSTYAVELLQHNEFVFKRLSGLRERECDQYELKSKLAHIRREVQISWKNKDYAKVATLYKPVESSISDAEKKKLAFAEKQVK